YKFHYLWHYLKWDEAEVVQTLVNEYNWECAKDTIQTWRTDDGTSPFYNLIYYTVGGFTENDCFRSNQVREGIINRSTALALVKEENRIRHDAVKNYLERVGLDYQDICQAVEKIPKFYESSLGEQPK
ncbi:MAG: glucosamine 6-phosphate synthetase, partial [Elusimicrobia bacterium]|nr:glucosamine 6-phosphate synthetase [Elusimicrobiota bacterium]